MASATSVRLTSHFDFASLGVVVTGAAVGVISRGTLCSVGTAQVPGEGCRCLATCAQGDAQLPRASAALSRGEARSGRILEARSAGGWAKNAAPVTADGPMRRARRSWAVEGPLCGPWTRGPT